MDIDLNSTGDDNPLRVFVAAKKEINGIFERVQTLASGIHRFAASNKDESIVPETKLSQVIGAIEKIASIRDVLARDHMKVVMFGRTSNGKSTVINAILRHPIVPSGIGHTTNCFLQVQGTDETEPYIEVDNTRMAIESVKQLANALNTGNLGDDTLVKIFWPKSKCPVLQDDVVLVDTPGTDVTANLDHCIDLYCLDADLFVLVSNAESTLMQTEKNFFLKVKQKLSKPNIFILNNRWDASAYEPETLDLVRKQHLTRDTHFLVEELNVVDHSTAKNRVFFVSAKEMLSFRMAEEANSELNTTNFNSHYEERFTEFVEFEKKFEYCLSMSAVQTKFGRHTQEGVQVIFDMNHLLDEITFKMDNLRNEKAGQIDYLKQRVHEVQQQFQLFNRELTSQISQLSKQVQCTVSETLKDQTGQLPSLVSTFSKSFTADKVRLAVYRKELAAFVEHVLENNLKSSLLGELSRCIQSTQKNMFEGVKSFLPEISEEVFQTQLASPQHFELSFGLNCESLCSDFHEDLEFRFSYSFEQIFRYLTGHEFRVFGSKVGSAKEKCVPLSGSPLSTNSVGGDRWAVNYALNKLQVLDRLSDSKLTITSLAVGGCLVRLVGWHLVALFTTIYGLLYTYERITWTNRAKQRSFQRQFVAHVTNKLRLVIDLTSANCSHQIRRELFSCLYRVNRMVEEVVHGLQTEIVKFEQEVEFLNKQNRTITALRGQVKDVMRELEHFSRQYL